MIMTKQSSNILKQLKPLRVVLILGALITLVLKPDIGTPVDYEGWGMVSTLLIPVLAPLFFMVLMLDALMSRVWMSEAQGEERKRLRMVVWIDLVIGVLMLIFWLPLFIDLAG